VKRHRFDEDGDDDEESDCVSKKDEKCFPSSPSPRSIGLLMLLMADVVAL
jgi:hypothetical protein